MATKAKGFPGDADYDPGTELDDILDPDLAKLLSQPPAAGWQPHPGSMVTGTVEEIDETDAGGFGTYPVVTILKDNGQSVAIHCFHEVLKNRITSLINSGRLTEGSKIGVVYYGKTDGGSFGGYENYKVVVKRQIS